MSESGEPRHPPAGLAHHATASAYLKGLIEAGGGWISVECFMREALFNPRFGYYARTARTVGRTGDFSTSATLSPALGGAIANWAWKNRCGANGMNDRRWHLIELGGGGGQMAAAIIKALGWWRSRGLRYHIVEISPKLREAQQSLLMNHRRVSWHDSIHSPLDQAGGAALIFSNEFVDAFPCRQWQFIRGEDGQSRDGEWREVGVSWPDGGSGPVVCVSATSAERPQGGPLRPGVSGFAGDEEFATALGETDFPHVSEGQRVESHLSYRRWLADWLPRWHTGQMLTIDYGDTLPELYHRRPSGTLRAYFRHMRLEGSEVFQRFGRQDLTADINFTDLQAWGRQLGLETLAFSTQRDFILQWNARGGNGGPASDFLLDPSGAGTAFKTMIQQPNSKKATTRR